MIHAVILAVVAALPAPTASPAATPAPPLFAAPQHWLKLALDEKPDGSTKTLASFQRYVDGYSQEFNVIQGIDTGLPLADLADVNVKTIQHDMNAQIVENGAVSVCGGHPAWRVKYHAAMHGKNMTMVQEFALGGDHTYVATYARLESAKDDADALSSLNSLCPPPQQAASADTADVPLQAPQGWRRIKPSAIAAVSPATSSLDLLGMWLGDTSSGFPESINVLRSPVLGGAQSIGDEVPLVIDMLKRQFPQLTMRQQHAEKLCEKYDGWYFEYATPMQGHDVIVEQTMVQTDNVVYIASYGRASSVPENAAARSAIDSLCPTDAKIAS